MSEATKYNDDDPALAVEAGRVRKYLADAMRDAPDGSRAKDDAKAAYIAFACVSITARAGKEFNAATARELAEADHHNDLFMGAVDRATALWRKAGGDPETLPDTGRLIYWLLGQNAALSIELDKALAIRPSVVRMSDKVKGPALTHEAALTPDNEAEQDEPAPPKPARTRERTRNRSKK